MEARVKAVRESVVDGIAITPRYRERQLANLHAGLLTSRSSLTTALVDDSSSTTGDAEAQFLLTAQAIKSLHTSVNPKQGIEDEYLIAQGKDNKARRVPYGYAYIIPSQHDPLYSTLVPIAAAIAAGNCIVAELQQTLSSVGQAVKKLLLEALSPQTFAVADSSPFDADFKARYCIELNGRETSDGVSTSTKLSTLSSRVAAIVDRSGDIRVAAKECVKARFGLGGHSAYAPDIVLVNEFCMQSFCSSATSGALQYLSGVSSSSSKAANGSALPNGNSNSNYKQRQRGLDADIQKKLDASSADILVSGDKGTVAVLKSRRNNDEFLTSQTLKLNSPLLLIAPISSMDDAINLLGQDAKTALRATYLFCAPPAAKYLGQFISSSITTVNHIPNELLIGAPAPAGHAVSIQPRYTSDMFSIAQPELIEVSRLSGDLSVLMSQNADVKDRRKAEEALNVKLERVKEAFGPPIGFFEQGILFGLTCVLVTAATIGTLTIKYGAPVMLAKLRGS